MVNAGKLGEIFYGRGAYLHDLREVLFSNKGEGLWRRAEHTMRDGNLYPTHGSWTVANIWASIEAITFRISSR